MQKSKNYFVSFFYFLFLITLILKSNHSFAALECIGRYEFGTTYKLIVPANGILITDNGYGTDGVKQRAAWTDSKLLTSGESFYFEIGGAWTPWYANTKEEKDIDGNLLNLVASNSIFCPLETINPKSTLMTTEGEFDYIQSVYEKPKRNEERKLYEAKSLSTDLQSACWLTGGEGLYISFFGGSGFEEPTVATHMKSAIIKCDAPYNTDKNADGFFSPQECYDIGNPAKKNMAYFAPYLSENMVGGVDCPADFFHGNNINKIGIEECYRIVEDKEGNKTRTNETLFTYKIDKFYKTSDKKKKVGRGEIIKFVIYDTYYADNEGQYIVRILSGIDSAGDLGLVEKILSEIETMFVGKRDSSGNLEGGVLKTLYNSIVKDSSFSLVVRLMLVLYMTFLGLSFAIGALEYSSKELLGIMLKLTFIMSFTTETSWYIYDSIIIKFFLDGFAGLIGMIANITLNIFDPTAYNPTSNLSFASKFAFIDQTALFLLSPSVGIKILGLLTGVWFGFLAIPIFYILVIYYILVLLNASYPYIIMFIQAIFALTLGPIFIIFYLFKSTAHMFKSWLAFVGAKFMNIAFLFLFLFIFNAVIREEFKKLLSFEVCKTPLVEAMFEGSHSTTTTMVLRFFSLGIQTWNAQWDQNYPQPGLFDFMISLLYIYILIKLFSMLLKKLPGLVDSMISIDGESGGGSSGSDSFTDALNDSIKVSYLDKNGKKQSHGFLEHYSGKVDDKFNEYIKQPVKGKIKKAFTLTKRGIKNSFSDLTKKTKATYHNDIMYSVDSMAGINGAVKEYRKSLKADNKDLLSFEVENKVIQFRKSLENDLVTRELGIIEVEAQKLRRKNSNIASHYAKDRFNDFLKENFDSDKTKIANYLDRYDDKYFEKMAGKETTSIRGSDYIKEKTKFQIKKLASEDLMNSKIETLSDYNKKMIELASSMRTKEEKDAINKKRIEAVKQQVSRLKRGVDTLTNKLQESLQKSDEHLIKLSEVREKQKMDNLKSEFTRLNSVSSKNKGLANFDEHLSKIQKMINGDKTISYEKLQSDSKEFDNTIQGLTKDDKTTTLDNLDLLSKFDNSSLETLERETAETIKDLITAEKILTTELGDTEIKKVVSDAIVEGINPDTFFMKGITGVGLGEDNDDILGFGKGAGALILGNEGEEVKKDLSEKKDRTIEKARLKITNQKVKILKFMLEKAKNNKDSTPSEIMELEEKLKTDEREIKLLKTKVDDD